MNELLTLSIGVGLVVSLLFSEVFGIAPGGLIVPGYFALFMDKPLTVAMTLLAGLVTYVVVHALSSVVILYGRRRTVMMILVGYLAGAIFNYAFHDTGGMALLNLESLSVIGYIIPGLIAIWYDRQGIVVTCSTLMIVSTLVRLSLIITIGTDIVL